MTSEAFTAAVIRMTPTLYRVARGQLMIEADQQDAVQEAIRRSWEKRGSLKNERYLQTWVIRILLNVCHDIQRHRKRECPVCEVPDSPSEPPDYTDLRNALYQLKDRLREYGYALTGDEPFKLALLPKGYGYTGGEMHNILRRENMECEFSDPDHLVMMLTPENSPAELDRLESTLRAVPRRIAIGDAPPPLPRPKRVLSMREALLSPQRWISAEDSLGCVLADASVSCPPAVPILVCGERIDRDAVACFRYYGVRRCSVIE